MKFSVERDILADAVAWASRAVPHRPPVPVLAGVLIEADTSGVVTLSSFDYEVSARGEFAADVEIAGSVLVSGRLLREISNALPHKLVKFASEGTKVSVTCGTSRFSLATMPVDQYPALPVMPETSGTVDGAELLAAAQQVQAAASRDETLPILTGVRMEIEGERISLLATDRYRLALRELTWKPGSPNISAIALVRAKTLADTAKSLGSGEVQLALSSGQGVDLIGFSAGGLVTTSLLMDGEYPQVRRLFPESSTITAVVSTAELIEATKRVSLVAERNAAVRLVFSEGELVLDAGHTDDAQASEAVPAVLTGPELEIAFNPGYLLDGLGAVGTAYSRISFTQPSRPAVLSGQDEEDGEADTSYRYVLMPVRFAS